MAPAHAGKVKSITSGTVAGGTELSPLYRNINPFYRNIGAFWGDVNPFYRNIGAFWGDISPFYRNIGAFSGDLNPLYRNIGAFWGDLNPLYRNIGAFGAIVPEYRNIGAFWEQTGTLWTGIDQSWASAGTYAANPNGYATLTTQLTTLRTQSQAFFGDAIVSQTGKSFDAFADPLFAKYGIDLANPASLEKLPANERSHFFMDWYDGLMDFTGTDHVDHWMKTANWSPLITQQQGSGEGTIIGLVDFYVAGDKDLQSKTVYNGGNSTYTNGHGAAVGSLIASAHDGKGVMGIAPNARIAAYNPFDASGTADWPDIKAGVAAVTKAGASVVNLSLGVPGVTFDDGWRGVFTDAGVKEASKGAIYVIAAGNDGITQKQNVDMTGALGSTFLVVGSVDPTGAISEFSNRPGTVCLTDGGKCENTGGLGKSGALMNRFIVAPGELILVSDDKGGTTRLSGTSFAAPLVSGAIALIQDRWPWLKKAPLATASIILRSAKDLGAPGVDPVYGAGLLDVAASQSPLDFNALKYYVVAGGKITEVKLDVIKQQGVQTSWEGTGIYLTAFEDVGGVKRDFLIPLSSRLIGTQQGGQYFQSFVYDRLVTWLGNGAPSRFHGFSDAGATGLANNPGELRIAMTARVTHPYASRSGAGRAKLFSTISVDAPSGVASFSFGQGDGAAVVGGQPGFGMRSDYDAQVGGVNPVLGFATGGAHIALKVRAASGLDIAVGTTANDRPGRNDLDRSATGLDRPVLARLGSYRARATNVQLDYRLSDAVSLTAAMTQLDEKNGLLGLQSLEPTDLAGGTMTRSATLGAEVALMRGLRLSASATAAQSRTSSDAALRLGRDGLVGTAFQVGATKYGLLGRRDRLRLSLAQPLRTERGSVDFNTVAVTDRETGDVGVVTQSFDVRGSKRRFVAEALYGATILNGTIEVSAFGRSELTGYESEAAGLPSYMAGGRVSLAF